MKKYFQPVRFSIFILVMFCLFLYTSPLLAQFSQVGRGSLSGSIADPQSFKHQPCLHHSFEDWEKEFIGHRQMPIKWSAPYAQAWVIDTALVYSTTDFTRNIYAFNGQSKVTIDLRERWTNNQWVNYEYSNYTYDANGRMLTESYATWGTYQWVPVLLTDYTYDSYGRLQTELYWAWVYNTWWPHDRITYTYDANGRILTELYETFDNQWVNLGRITYTYDGNGRMQTVLLVLWMNSQWLNYARGTYTYDTNGRLLTELGEVWMNNQWANSSRNTYTYDTNGRLLTELGEQWMNNQWANSSRNTYTYDTNGRLFTDLGEAWTNNQWLNSSHYTYTYDTNGNMVLGQYEDWQAGGWVSGNGSFSVADSAGNFSYWGGYRVMLQYQFVITDVARYISENPIQYELRQNYPNPFNPNTVIEFSLPENVGNVKLSIYSALGEKVAELVNTALVAGKYSYQWIAQNVATGMYIYELRTDKFVSVKKMILLK